MRDLILGRLVWLFGRLPFSWAGRVGALAGRLMYLRDGREARNARVNLSMCFPELDEAAREAYRRAGEALGFGLGSLFALIDPAPVGVAP